MMRLLKPLLGLTLVAALLGFVALDATAGPLMLTIAEMGGPTHTYTTPGPNNVDVNGTVLTADFPDLNTNSSANADSNNPGGVILGDVHFSAVLNSKAGVGTHTFTITVTQDGFVSPTGPGSLFSSSTAIFALDPNDTTDAMGTITPGGSTAAIHLVGDNTNDPNAHAGNDSFNLSITMPYALTGTTVVHSLTAGANTSVDQTVSAFSSGPPPIPEPSSLTLLGIGALASVWFGRRRFLWA